MEEEAFEREYGIPVTTKGSAAISRGGMALLLLVLGIVLGSLLLSYFYIRLDNPVWPPMGIQPRPGAAGSLGDGPRSGCGLQPALGVPPNRA